MANNFAGILTIPFRGATYRMPVKLPQGVAYPSNQVPPSVCPVTIDWNIYWQLGGNPSNVAVSLNLQAASVQSSILDRIASVKIDNTGSPNSVYVQFPDTGDVINCPPNCTVTFPCLTNLLNATIVALGLTPGFIPTTRIFFYNVTLPPSVDYEVNQSIALWKASPTITRGSTLLNTNYAVPALGDQTVQASVSASNIGPYIQGILSPQPSGFYIFTNIIVQLSNFTSTGNINGIFYIESTGAAGILYQFNMGFGAFGTQTTVPIVSIQPAQIKVVATETWQIRNTLTGGGANSIISLILNYTYTPTNN